MRVHIRCVPNSILIAGYYQLCRHEAINKINKQKVSGFFSRSGFATGEEVLNFFATSVSCVLSKYLRCFCI